MWILTLYCRDQAVAEELAQDSQARAWARWDHVSKLDNPSAWLYRVAINLGTSLLRRRAAEQRAHARLEGGLRERQYTEPSSLAAIAVRDAIASLSRRQRSVIVLHYFLDLSFPEIAEVTNLPLSTVKSLTRRGRERLKRALAEHPEEVPDAV